MSLLKRRVRVPVWQLKRDQDVEGLWHELRRNDPETRTEAKRALASIGGPAVPTLVRALTKPDRSFGDGTSLHSKAIRILDLMGPDALNALVELSESGDRSVRREAQKLLPVVRRKYPVEANALPGAERDDPDELLDRLQRLGNPDDARVLLSMGDDRAVEATVAALQQARRLRDRVGLLRALADSGNAMARDAARANLRRVGHILSIELEGGREAVELSGYLKGGPMDHRLRTAINTEARSRGRAVSLSEDARIKLGHDEMLVEDRKPMAPPPERCERYTLRIEKHTKPVEVGPGHARETVEFEYHTLVMELADDDPRMVKLMSALDEPAHSA